MIRIERPWRPAPPRRRTPAAAVRARLLDVGVEHTYSLAFSLRSGSTLVANTLAAHGVGRPAEYFQYPYTPSRHATSGARWFGNVVVAESAAGWFGTKLAHDHRAHLDGHLARLVADYTTIDDVLPDHRWLFVSRRDPIAQAVSLWVAEQTGRWHVRTGGDDEGNERSSAVEYDFFGILSKVMILGAQDANWRSYFAAHGLQPVEVVYDDFVVDPARELARIASHLDLDPDHFRGVDLDRDGSLRRISGMDAVGYARHRERFMDDFLRIGDPLQAEVYRGALANWNAFFSEEGWRV